jgi:DNA-directed RNA polymerase subunit RPC12/RpoP
MAVETLGEAYSLGWNVIARSAYGKGGDGRMKGRDCVFRQDLDMATLVWTRGRDFQLSRLESRLRCPQCGSRIVVVLFQPPTNVAVRRT